MSDIGADEIISRLGLQPHPKEGGYFRETWRSAVPVNSTQGPRSAGTAIYYFLTPDSYSAMHRLCTDEVFHFYLGDPVQMLQLWPDGSVRTLILGIDLRTGQLPQVVVPAGVWQGSFLVEGGRHALMGATVAPGFEYADYESGNRSQLVAAYPHAAVLIHRLTPATQ
jgi:predicted cupin superfamily sugar epimerase